MSQKKPKSKNLRHILKTPFNFQWSESNPDGVALLQKALEELLPQAKLEKKNLNLKSTNETKEQPQPTTPATKNPNIFRTFLSPGFQSVIRGLEKNELCCVLMAGDISPPMIQRVICSYCSANDVPLMVVPELKAITKSTLGFSAMVLGLKKIADSTENPFFPIYEIVSQNCSVIEIPFVAKQNNQVTPERRNKCITRNDQSCVSSVKVEDVYLFRKSKNERIFRPNINYKNSPLIQQPNTHGMDGDFICFSNTGSEQKSSEFEVLSRNIPDIGSKCDSEDDSDDSLDEENIFFVDNKPDHMLLDTDSSNNAGNDSQSIAELEGSGIKPLQNQGTLNSPIKKVKAICERYFSGLKSDQTKKKESKTAKLKPNDLVKAGIRNKDKSSVTLNSLSIKTVISNPKKIRRKKK